MLRTTIISCALIALSAGLSAQTMGHSHKGHASADTQRQEDVSQRGKDVMPFDLAAATHIFTKTAEGGIQKVVAK